MCTWLPLCSYKWKMYIKIEKQANESCASTKFDLNTEQMKCARSTFVTEPTSIWLKSGRRANERTNATTTTKKQISFSGHGNCGRYSSSQTKIARLNSMRVERKVFCAMMMTHEARRNLKRELIIFWTLFACLLTYYHIIKFGANFRERGSERTRDSFEFDSILMRLCAQKISYTWAVLDISVVIGCVVLLLPSFRMFVVFFFS